MNWAMCRAVEIVPDRMSGSPVLRGTRVRPEDLLINREEGVDWLVHNYGVDPDAVREVFAFYDEQMRLRAPHPA